MKNIILISIIIISILGTSCKKKDSVEFKPKDYSLHFNDTIKLNVSTKGVDLKDFNFTSQDTNVVKVNKDGLVYGVFVGSTTVTVCNGDIFDKCNITVEPYEKLFIVPLLDISELNKEQLKFIELRELKSEYDNSLTYYPFEDENGIDSLRYLFTGTSEVIETIYFKDNVAENSIIVFLTERYRKSATNEYKDHNTGAVITYEKEDNNENARLIYLFK